MRKKVIIVGAGFAGLYALYKLRKDGHDVLLIEAGSGVGGTWYWNRYPGARVDIESVEYSYSFSEELQQDWSWSERYASQPEILRYLNHVADRFDLRGSIRLNTRIASATFDQIEACWRLTTTSGEELVSSYCIMATGFLSAPNQPAFPGINSFSGTSYHTAHWPREAVSFAGKKVGIIGTGSSAVQTIPIVAQEAEHLTVFQRTPPYAVPLRNCKMPPDYEKDVKANYAEWRRIEKHVSFGGYIAVNFGPASPVTKFAAEASEEERVALYEDRWQSGGLALYHVYPDCLFDEQANETLASFIRGKIRQRVNDPDVADLLVPTDYPILVKRLCADTGYYETYNRDNVSLVDIRGKELSIYENGVRVSGNDHELDCIIYATGFDALTGALLRMDIRSGDQKLADHWQDGARTALGIMISGFPNLFMLNGPGTPCPVYQPVLLGEEQVDLIAGWLEWLDGHGKERIEPSKELEDGWVKHCTDSVNATLFPKAISWYIGGNIPGKPPVGMIYLGGIANYRERLRAVLPSEFSEFHVA